MKTHNHSVPSPTPTDPAFETKVRLIQALLDRAQIEYPHGVPKEWTEHYSTCPYCNPESPTFRCPACPEGQRILDEGRRATASVEGEAPPAVVVVKEQVRPKSKMRRVSKQKEEVSKW